MPVKRNNPNLPSCETVVQDGVGMRIKGIINGRLANTRCKVRNIADAQGNVVRYNKQNLPKTKAKTNQRQSRVNVSLEGGTGANAILIYDTGATSTQMSTADARLIGIIKPDGTSDYHNQPQRATGIGGSVATTQYSDVPLILPATGEVTEGSVLVYPNAIGLLGISHIK